MSRTYEPGFYKGRILSWMLSESKEKGTPQFAITFSVDEDAHGNQMDGGERTTFRYLTDATAEYVAKDLLALGYDRDDFDGLDPEGADPFDFLNVEVRVKLAYETYQEKEREKWELAMTGGLQLKKMEKSGVSKLNNAFGPYLKAARRAAGKTAAPKPPPPARPAGGSDENIPF